MLTKRKLPVFAVGLFLLIGLAFLGWMVVQLGTKNKVQDGYKVFAEFRDASGIIKGGVVRLAGADVGYVADAPTLNAMQRVVVPIIIRKDLILPANTRFEIVSLTLLGDKAIYLRIPEKAEEGVLKEGDYVVGVSPQGIGDVQLKAEELTANVEQLMAKTGVTFDQLDETLISFKQVADKLDVSLTRLNDSVLGEEKLAEMSVTLANVREASQSFKEVTGNLHPLTDEIRQAVTELNRESKQTLQVYRGVATDANKTLGVVNDQMELVAPVLKTLPKTVETYAKVGESLEKAFTNEDSFLATMTGDKGVKDDARTFIKNLRTNGILGYKDDTDPEKSDPRDRYRGMRR